MAAGGNYPQPGPGPTPPDPTMTLPPEKVFEILYEDMITHHEEFKRYLMMERERLAPQAQLNDHVSQQREVLAVNEADHKQLQPHLTMEREQLSSHASFVAQDGENPSQQLEQKLQVLALEEEAHGSHP